MTDHAHSPASGTDAATLRDANDNLPLAYFDFTGHLRRTLHLSLEQHGAYVVLERLIERHGFHQVLDDPALICAALRCTAEHWHDTIAPAIVPILESEQEAAA